MPSSIYGLPLHPLIAHAAVVMVPLAALAVLAAVLVPRFRRWAGPMPMLLSLVALVLTPLSTASGENLEEQVDETSLVEQHAELGEQLLFFTIALFVLSAAFWWLDRRARTSAGDGDTRPRQPMLTTVVGVLAVLVAVGAGVQLARIGHSGAEAVWSDVGASSGG